MKFFNKTILFVLAASAMGFVACDDDDEYVPGAPQNNPSTKVYFVNEQPISYTLDIEEDSVSIVLERDNSDEDMTIELECLTSTPEAFSKLPASVTFKAGEAQAVAGVCLAYGVEYSKAFNLTLVIPEKYVAQYDSTDVYPRFNVQILREDYKPVAYGTWTTTIMSAMFGTQISSECYLEYSESFGQYRIKDPYYVSPRYCVEGYNMLFQMEGDSVTYSSDVLENGFATGFTHPSYASYGMCRAYPIGLDPDAEEPLYGVFMPADEEYPDTYAFAFAFSYPDVWAGGSYLIDSFDAGDYEYFEVIEYVDATTAAAAKKKGVMAPRKRQIKFNTVHPVR
ncbi:MAG: hypothetical protein ACI353_00140 [Alloprevotella sp.]